MKIYAYRYIEGFGQPIEFENTVMETDEQSFASFPSVDPATLTMIEESEVDIGVQVMPPKTTSSSQTGFSFKRNKIIQYESQYLDPEEAKIYLESPVELKVSPFCLSLCYTKLLTSPLTLHTFYDIQYYILHTYLLHSV